MSDNLHLPATHVLHGKTVAIVGGGPAGLTLARLLHLQGVQVHVFDSDAGRDARTQGGSLDLHPGTGQQALERCGLADAFRRVSRPEGQALVVYDRHGVLRGASKAEDEASPEIDRGVLRDILLDSLPDALLHWSSTIMSVDDVGSGRLGITFTDHRPAFLAEVVVGCDGIWSKVRPRVCAELPRYTGATFIEARLSEVDADHAELAALVGHGALLGLGDGRGILAQRNGDGSIRVYAANLVDESELARMRSLAAPALKRTLLGWYADWAPSLTALLERADGPFKVWPLFTLPPALSWPTHPCVTLLGDAAHVMPPYTGKGANSAMKDALELADCLAHGVHGTLHDALLAFESGMHARLRPLVEETLAMQSLVLAADAPRALIELMHPLPEGFVEERTR